MRFAAPVGLEFPMPEVVAVVVSVYILFQISGGGETNWIEGVQLFALFDSRLLTCPTWKFFAVEIKCCP
jgi:Ca2+/H+ antiporter